jgi:D-erythrulose 1-phosphate 3-epimerase
MVNQDQKYPEIYLAIDNCFASKRFTEPHEWMSLIKDLGLKYIEASADTECDPLYMTPEYIENWLHEVKKTASLYNTTVCNLYSGHGTYATLGLSHTSLKIRDRILNEWLKPMVGMASDLGAGLGFYCHAFADQVLQDPGKYYANYEDLVARLAELSEFAADSGCSATGVEQMYSPHQIPWTINGALNLIKEVYKKSGKPFYITIDTGHQSGQSRFRRISEANLMELLKSFNGKSNIHNVWLGPQSAYDLLERSSDLKVCNYDDLVRKIGNEMDKYPYLFSEPQDSSPYRWLEELACYSPIIHLQQTDGTVSNHRPFTKEYNDKGIIDGEKLLVAIKRSYEKSEEAMPGKVEKIFLTIEVFASTASINFDTINQLKETIRYWRQFVPEDGKVLDELV